jgi:glycosyltransferase involved in cell wall biosynthesis
MEILKEFVNYNFRFILLSRYPTEKAYGATTEYSARVLHQGGISTVIVTPQIDYTRNSKVKVYSRLEFISRILLTRKTAKLKTIRFNIFILLYSFSIRNSFRKNKNVYWCRDLYLTYLLSILSKDFFICEIHRTPDRFQGFFLKLLSKKPNVLLAPIANFLPSEFTLDADKSVLAPMAISLEELDFFSKNSRPKQKKLIYLGNPYSSIYPLNVDLLNEVGYHISDLYPDWVLEIIGIEECFFTSNISRAKCKNILLPGVLSRKNAHLKLATASIGLIIYPNHRWFQDSFPIKIVEYSAASIAIIASDTLSHKRILDDQRCVYFDLGSIESLKLSVSRLIEDTSYRNRLATNSRAWSEYFTYENRVKKILEKLNFQIFRI